MCMVEVYNSDKKLNLRREGIVLKSGTSKIVVKHFMTLQTSISSMYNISSHSNFPNIQVSLMVGFSSRIIYLFRNLDLLNNFE